MNVRLKHLARIAVSNVDKKTVSDEQSVRLCNYTDVYYNERITADLPFMEATASVEQIERFGLRADDVLLTKDSETPYDIAIPAYVVADLPDVVCGYHLALLRPSRVDGRYLFWALASRTSREQFSASANGITRFGLRYDSFGEVRVPLPPLATQRAIADYLDRETARIDALINAEKRRVALAEERLLAETQGEVIGRFDVEPRQNDPSGPLLPTPEGWLMRRNKTFLREVVDLSEDGSEELLSVSHLTGVTPRAEKEVTMFLAESNIGYKRVRPGDVVVNTMWAWMGALGVSKYDGIVSPAYGVYRFYDCDADPLYFDALFQSPAYVEEMNRYSKGVWTSRLRLYPESFLSLRSPFPPAGAQRRIAERVRSMQRGTERLSALLERSVDLLQERRQALITAAVTGELEVPGVAA